MRSLNMHLKILIAILVVLGIHAIVGGSDAVAPFAVRAEGARNLDDVLDRRTRIGLVAKDRDAAYDAAAELVETALRTR